MGKTLLELMASKYAYQLLSFINTHPRLSKSEIVRSFPTEEEKTRYTRLGQLENAGLIEQIDDNPDKRRSKRMMVTEKGSQILTLCTGLSSSRSACSDPRIHDGFAWLTAYYNAEKASDTLLDLPSDFYDHVKRLDDAIDATLTGDANIMKHDRLNFLVRELREMRLDKIWELARYNGNRTNTVDIPFHSNLQKEMDFYDKAYKLVTDYCNI